MAKQSKGGRSRGARSAVIAAGAIALVLLVGGIAADVLKGEIATWIGPHPRMMWAVALIALLAAVGAAMWLKAGEIPDSSAPSIELVRAPPSGPSPEASLLSSELFLLLPGSEAGALPRLLNKGSGPARVERVILEVVCWKEHRVDDQPVTFAMTAIQWRPSSRENVGAEWTNPSAHRWECQVPTVVDAGGYIFLPNLSLEWDEHDLDVYEEIDRQVGKTGLLCRFEATLFCADAMLSTKIELPLRILRRQESLQDSGIEELTGALLPGQEADAGDVRKLYEAIRKRDYDLRTAFASTANEIFAQREIEARAEDIAEFSSRIASDPRDADAYIGQASIYAQVGAWSRALASLEKAFEMKQSPEILIEITRCYLELDRPVDALRSVDEALATADNDAEGWHLRGKALLQLERSDEAVQSLLKATMLDNSDISKYQDYGGALLNVGQNEQAADAYKRAIELGDKDPATRLTLAISIAGNRPDDEVLSEIKLALDAGYDNVEVLRTMFLMLSKSACDSVRAMARSALKGKKPLLQ